MFQNFESFIKIKGIDEEDNKFTLKLYSSHFIEHEIEPGLSKITPLIEELTKYNIYIPLNNINRKTKFETKKILSFFENLIQTGIKYR